MADNLATILAIILASLIICCVTDMETLQTAGIMMSQYLSGVWLVAAMLLNGCAEMKVERDVGPGSTPVQPRRLVIHNVITTDVAKDNATDIEKGLQAGLQSCGVASIVYRDGTDILANPAQLASSAASFKADYILGIGSAESIQGAVIRNYFAAILESTPTVTGSLISFPNRQFWKLVVSVTIRPPFSHMSQVPAGVVGMILQGMVKDGIIRGCNATFDIHPVS